MASRGCEIDCSMKRLSFFHHLKHKLHFSSSKYQPPTQLSLRDMKWLQHHTYPGLSKLGLKDVSRQLLDSVADSLFKFEDQPLLPTQANFAPVEELKHVVLVDNIDGHLPLDFPMGVYARIGSNPLFGGLKSTRSVVGRTGHIWIEGEGMIHALYFLKDHTDHHHHHSTINNNKLTVLYKNRYVESETMKLEQQRNKPLFIPAIEGHSPAILLAILLNLLRFGRPYKLLSNTNIFEHGGKFYASADNHTPQEIDIQTLDTLGSWDVHGAWKATTFTSHPKKAPDGSGELVVIGMNPFKPFMEVGVISADGILVHKSNPELERCTLAHDFGLTKRFIVILDFPLTIGLQRLLRGGPLVSYNNKDYARIGVMPRYGDSNSIQWFDVDPSCTLHILNSFEDGDEVVVWGCRSLESVLSSHPGMKLEECEWIAGRLRPTNPIDQQKLGFSSRDDLLSVRGYEWRLNIQTRTVSERYLTGTEFDMEFPTMNVNYSGIKNRYAYTQVVDKVASTISGMPKFGSLAKLYFEEKDENGFIMVEFHKLEDNTFCSGATFVPKQSGISDCDEDDGWLVTFTHNEQTNTSKVYIIDAKKFEEDAVAKITLPYRVPYGFHGAFFPMASMEDIQQ